MGIQKEYGVSRFARAFCERELRVTASALMLIIRGDERRRVAP